MSYDKDEEHERLKTCFVKGCLFLMFITMTIVMLVIGIAVLAMTKTLFETLFGV